MRAPPPRPDAAGGSAKTVDGVGSGRGDATDAAVAPSSTRRRPTFGPCEHGVKPRSKCKVCSACPHGKWRKFCKACGGGAFCEHAVVKYSCVKCAGGSVCPHGRRRTRCRECGGGSMCEHRRQRHRCKECGGASVCAHDRLRYRCKECLGEAAAKW